MKGLLINAVLYFLSWFIPKLFERLKKCDEKKAEEVSCTLYEKYACKCGINNRESPADADENINGGKGVMKIAISSGHGARIAGAIGVLNEVTEARKMVARVSKILRERGATVAEFHDDVSTTVGQNINTIVGWHLGQDANVDVSVHFNAFTDPNAHGTEVLYRTPGDQALASNMAEAIARASGLRLRPAQGGAVMPGASLRNDLGFLNSLTTRPSILLEVCFVTSQRDAGLYNTNFEAICTAIADALQ